MRAAGARNGVRLPVACGSAQIASRRAAAAGSRSREQGRRATRCTALRNELRATGWELAPRPAVTLRELVTVLARALHPAAANELL